ncbi:hypothetical protein Sste5346_005099 [Sporothrix stenoceras]|uniref:beta-N-acetylhexosaminidase n=1 Tax=Sporothrix stenoceras TaxID=5173 RepID=A0ABR3Z4S3_9PEZI
MARLSITCLYLLVTLLGGFLEHADSTSYLEGIPTIPFTSHDSSQGNGFFSLRNVQKIIIDKKYANATDQDGSTLIPPTLLQFANIFVEDVQTIFKLSMDVELASQHEEGQVFLTVDRGRNGFVDAAGRFTSEGYQVEVNATGIIVTGASPLGVWWATRTLLQQALLHKDISIPWGRGTDNPGWATRGVMLDVGRHFYPADFLVEMCAYMSFFKQNTFHLHLSDNLWNNPRYTTDDFMGLYARLRLWADDNEVAVRGLNRFANESYTRQQFDDIQTRCAARGVTVLPEIEAPGHALVLTQWKPQLAYGRDMSLLNISHPETIPTMKAVWGVFLKWFHCKVVSIGADEYQGPAGDYYYFVNILAGFIGAHSGKQVRTWGMFPPARDGPVGPPGSARRPIFQNISIQHWEFFEDDAYNDYIRNNYSVVNSNDDFYVVNKYGGEGGYPNRINVSRTFGDGDSGSGPWRPNLFDQHNATRNPPADNPYILGAIAALWNDPGPNASVYSEAYYAWREGIPALADKHWGGNLSGGAFNRVFAKIHPYTPGQNLERRIPSNGPVVFNYTFDKLPALQSANTLSPSPLLTRVVDTSPNGYDAETDCSISTETLADGSSTFVNITPDCSLRTPLTSKGRNYTLALSLRITSKDDPTNTTLLSGRDSALMLTPTLTLFASGNYYRLPPSKISFDDWVDVRIISRGNQTFAEMTPSSSSHGTTIRQEFRAEIGLHGDGMKSVEIAIEAPLHTLGGAGSGWTGQARSFSLSSEA